MKYIPASEVEKAMEKRFALSAYDGTFQDGVDAMKHELDALLASAVELPEPGLGNGMVTEKDAIEKIVDKSTFGVLNNMTLNLVSTEIISALDSIRPVPDDKLREAASERLKYWIDLAIELEKRSEVMKTSAHTTILCDIRAALRKEGA